MKWVMRFGGAAGLAALLAWVWHSDLAALGGALVRGGWPLLWLLPYRVLFFFCYACGWQQLLRALHAPPIGLALLTWASALREAVDRLLPVASVGGALIAVRLLGEVGISGGIAGATVIAEVVLTLSVSWAFAVAGVSLLPMPAANTGWDAWELWLLLGASLAVPVCLTLLVSGGSVFTRAQGALARLIGLPGGDGAQALDASLQRLFQAWGALAGAGVWQGVALLTGAGETWLALHLLAVPVSARDSVILESLMQGARQVAFMVPASLGVQETVLILVGAPLGVSRENALALSLIKRAREVLCAAPPLLWWQCLEATRGTRRALHAPPPPERNEELP